MATIRLRVTSGQFKFNIALDNLYFDERKSMKIELSLPDNLESGMPYAFISPQQQVLRQQTHRDQVRRSRRSELPSRRVSAENIDRPAQPVQPNANAEDPDDSDLPELVDPASLPELPDPDEIERTRQRISSPIPDIVDREVQRIESQLNEREARANPIQSMQPDINTPVTQEAKQPEAKQPEAKQPDIELLIPLPFWSKPYLPNVSAPETRTPESTQPESKQPESKQPESKQPAADEIMLEFLTLLSQIQTGSSGRPTALSTLNGIQSGSSGRPISSAALNGPDQNPDPDHHPVLDYDPARETFVSRAGDPARRKVPIGLVIAALPQRPLTQTDLENQAMYRETFSVLDDWLLTMMNVQGDPVIVEFAKVLDKAFGKYLLKIATRLDDNTFARMISMMELSAVPVVRDISDMTRLKSIMIGFRQGLLNEVLDSLNTPGCNCEFCKI